VTSLSRTWRIFGNVCQPHLLVRCEKCFRLSAPESLEAIAGPKQWMLHAPVIPLTRKRLRAAAPGPFTRFPGSTRSPAEVSTGTTIYRGPAVSRHGRFGWRFNIHVWLRPLRLVHGPPRFWECCVIDQTSISGHGTSELRSSSKTVGTAWPLDREFRATKIVFERARAHEKIAFMTPYVVEEVHNVANKSVEAVRVRNLDILCTVSSLLICLNGGDPRIYYRGNKSGVDAQFAQLIKRLAFRPNFPEEQTLPEILPDPLPVVATALSHRALERIWREHSLMKR
jgi:hypothetical protein